MEEGTAEQFEDYIRAVDSFKVQLQLCFTSLCVHACLSTRMRQCMGLQHVAYCYLQT